MKCENSLPWHAKPAEKQAMSSAHLRGTRSAHLDLQYPRPDDIGLRLALRLEAGLYRAISDVG